MDFTLTEDQLILQRTTRDFAVNELEPHAAKIDEEELFPSDHIKKMARLGLMGLTIDEKYGGVGGNSIHLAIAIEEIARACASTSAIYLASLSLACHTIYRFGSDEQKQQYLPALTKGTKLACFALTEPEAGSDAASIQTIASRQGDRYVLDGNKIFVTNGSEADVSVVFATADRSMRHKGIVALIVERGAPGFCIRKKERKLGIRGSSTAELTFDGCRIPVENCLAGEGKGFGVAMAAIDSSRVSVAAQAVGIARGAFEAAISYAQKRKQFGQAISSFQAVQWMLADMATYVDAARLLTYRAASLKDDGLPYIKEAAMAKLFAAEAAMQIATKAVQVHGGYGFIKDYPVERFFRDAKITEIYEGTSEMQRMTIAKQLLA